MHACPVSGSDFFGNGYGSFHSCTLHNLALVSMAMNLWYALFLIEKKLYWYDTAIAPKIVILFRLSHKSGIIDSNIL